MGRKINPVVFRTGEFYTWKSRWFADKKNYRKYLLEDKRVRDALMAKLKPAGISRVEIERSINKVAVLVFVARPGVVIGRGGSGLEELKKYLLGLLNVDKKSKNTAKIDLKVEPVKEPNLDAYLMAVNIADQLQKRLPFRRVLNHSIERIMGSGARGAKILLAGRIAGAEIARREKIKRGVLPLSTLREKIDFAKVAALTKSGFVGVKVWICKK